jgi:hypothetical protein
MATAYTYDEIMGLREDWKASLLNPDIGQVTGRLADDAYENFCCIGVLTDKVDVACARTSDGRFTYTLIDLEDSERDSTISLEADVPQEVMARLGMTGDMQSFLIGLNDDARLDFKRIAEVINTMPVIGSPEFPEYEWDENNFILYNMHLFQGARESWWINKLSNALSVNACLKGKKSL